jgi:hypothetical protein
MRRTLISLMVLGVISGCSGGESGGGTTGSGSGDKQAPVVTVAAAGTIEGGDTTAITVTVTDNVDTGLTYALTCDGGTLTGNLLATTAVTADATIKCTATATDKSGNTGTGNLSIVVKPRTTSLTAVAGSTQVTAGGFGLLIANNLPLGEASYEGTFNGRTVKLLRTAGNELLFVMPLDMPAGGGKLNATIAGHSYSIDVTVGAAITVGDPRGEVRSILLNAKTALNDALALPGLSAADRTKFQAQLPKIDEAIVALPLVSDADMAKFASILAAYGLTGTRSAAAYNPISGGENCGAAAKTFSVNLVKALAGLAIVTGATTVGIMVGAAAPILVIPDIIFAGVGIAAGAYITVNYGRKAAQSWDAFFSSCWTEVSFDLIPNDLFQANSQAGYRVEAIAVTGKQAFQQNKARSFKVQRSFSPTASMRAEVNRYASDIAGLLAAASFLPADVRTGLAAFKNEGTEIVPASRLSLSGITRGDIAGSLSGSGDTITLKFGFTDPKPTTNTNVDFGFTLNRSGEAGISVPAQLSIALPEADDAAIEAIQGKATSSNVQARGAESLEIVAQPGHGTVTLQNSGAFTYTPSGQYFGPDTFTYRARNDQGVSKTATVTVSVVRKFDGVWNITSTSTTTSQSQPGLCPNEVNRFSIGVSKSSDTLYVASYEGVPINLTMGSKDDPAGLRGSASATYDDGPGTTTESVSVQVPDSSHITGSGSWSYSGPSGTRCSGTTSVTGTR